MTVSVEHKNDLPWWQAPKPRRWHRCTPQTSGVASSGRFYERCACGAARIDGYGPWMEQNSRDESRRSGWVGAIREMGGILWQFLRHPAEYRWIWATILFAAVVQTAVVALITV